MATQYTLRSESPVKRSEQVRPGPDLGELHADFPALQQEHRGQRLVYLDSAATTQRPQPVLDAETDFYSRDNANVHRGLHELSRRATERFEAARLKLASFLNAPDPREIIWVRGATEAINLVAQSWAGANLRPGDEIVLSLLEHHSNIVPWQLVAERIGARIRYLDIDESGRLRLDELDRLLNERTRLVAVGHVSNALGTINPVQRIIERARAAGARVLVDGAQGAAHLAVDVQALGCDFYALSGHKMCGPMGIGVLWARTELLEAMPPYQGGGEMIKLVEAERSTWADLPHKFEAGTPNVAGAIGLAAAVDYLEGPGFVALRRHERELTVYGMERLASVPGLTLFGPTDPEERIALFSFKLDGVHPHDVATILDAEGIAVRAGHHCTQPLMRRLGEAATTRASCYFYNTKADIDRLIAGLEVVRQVFGS